MPYGKRTFKVYGGGQREKLVRVPWSKATAKEKAQAGYLYAASGVAAVAILLSYGDDIVGQRDKQVPELEQVTKLRSDARETYKDASLLSKYSTSFLIRQRSETGGKDNDRGGSGFIGGFSDPDMTARITVGRTCLRGTPYDTTPDKAKPSSVAALVPTAENSVTIYPAGSDAPALQFTLDKNSNFIPSAETQDTLLAYNCRYLGRLPVREAYYNDHTEDWAIITPLFARDQASLE